MCEVLQYEKEEEIRLFHELVMLVLQDFGGRLGIVEKLIDLLDLLPLHRFFSLNTTQQTGWSQQLDGVPEMTNKMLSTHPFNLICPHFDVAFHSERSIISVPEGCLGADLCQVCQSFLADADPLNLSTDLDDLKAKNSSVRQTKITRNASYSRIFWDLN